MSSYLIMNEGQPLMVFFWINYGLWLPLNQIRRHLAANIVISSSIVSEVLVH
jgi:hypothetical protein